MILNLNNINNRLQYYTLQNNPLNRTRERDISNFYNLNMGFSIQLGISYF